MEVPDSSLEKDNIILEHLDGSSTHRRVPVPPALHHDLVAPEAVGGLYEEMPKGYFWSKGFLGTLAVSTHLSHFPSKLKISRLLVWPKLAVT